MKITSYKIESSRFIRKTHAETKSITSFTCEPCIDAWFHVSLEGNDGRRYTVEFNKTEAIDLIDSLQKFIDGQKVQKKS